MRRLGLILIAAICGVGLACANGFAADNGDGASDPLSDYLHAHRLPLVEARLVTDESGRRTLMLYGFVATAYGKRDAEDQARDFMDDPDIAIINHVKVRPELLTLGTGANNSNPAAALDAPPDPDYSADGSVPAQEQASTAQATAAQAAADFPDTIGNQQDYANQERDDEFLLSNGVGFSGAPLAMVILGSGAIMPPLSPPFLFGPRYWPPIANQPPLMFPPVILIQPPVYQPPNRFAGFPRRLGSGYYPSPFPAGPTPMFPATGGMPPFPSAFGPGFGAAPGFSRFTGHGFSHGSSFGGRR